MPEQEIDEINIASRAGVIGAGLIGRKRAESLKSRVEFVGVFDSNPSFASRFSAEFGVENFGEASLLLREVGPGGIVFVSTPNSYLVGYALEALKSGCHVHLEKPGGTSSKELKDLADEAERRGLSVTLGYNHRFHPALQSLANDVKTRKFGKLLLVRAVYGHGGRVGYDREWRFSRQFSGGGELIDQGSHIIDLALCLGGQFKINYASLPALYWPGDVEDNAFIFGEFDTGGRLSMHASWTEWKNTFRFEVFCETAKLEVIGLGGSYGPEVYSVYEMPGGLGPPEIRRFEWPPGDTSWDEELESILGRHDFPLKVATVREGITVLEMVEEAYLRWS